jgi:hypothetical protein
MARKKNNTAGRNAAHSAAHTAPAPAPVPDARPAPSNPAAAVQAALAASPDGATAVGIATAAGLRRAAAGKALAELEIAGAAERTKGGRPGIPDTWRLAAAAPAGLSPDTAGAAGDPAIPGPAGQDEAAAQPATAGSEPGGQGQPPVTGQPASSPDAEDQDGPGSQHPAGEPGQDGTAAPGDADGQQAGDSPAAGDGTETSPDPAVTAEVAGHASQIVAAAQAVTTALQAGDLRAALAGIEEACEQASQARRTLKAVTGGKKAPAVKPGALRELVAAHLRDYPGGNFTPHQIGKKLGRSSGAVANALDTLVKLGDAELATEKPRSFRLAGNAGSPAGKQPGAAPAGNQPADGGASEEPVAGAA